MTDWISVEDRLPEPEKEVLRMSARSAWAQETGGELSVEMDLKFAASHAKEAAERKRAEGCLDCADEHLQLAEWLEELQAYKDTGVSAQDLQDVVDLFIEATVSDVDIPKELKRWMERCTWHVRKCSELSEKLGRAKEDRKSVV